MRYNERNIRGYLCQSFDGDFAFPLAFKGQNMKFKTNCISEKKIDKRDDISPTTLNYYSLYFL